MKLFFYFVPISILKCTLLEKSLFLTSLLQYLANNMALLVQKVCGDFFVRTCFFAASLRQSEIILHSFFNHKRCEVSMALFKNYHLFVKFIENLYRKSLLKMASKIGDRIKEMFLMREFNQFSNFYLEEQSIKYMVREVEYE